MLELTYHWEGDYLIPDLEPPQAPRIGKYGTNTCAIITAASLRECSSKAP